MDLLWRLVETCHAVVYYADERQGEYTALGLKGGWMGYFASRAGALGAVGPEVVTACFYGFAPAMVARALPDAWGLTTPEAAVAARLRVADQALRRLLGNDCDAEPVRRAADRMTEAVRTTAVSGRPLFAAHAALAQPDLPHLQLFWAAAALREYRGDGHVTALSHSGVDGCEAHVLMASMELVPPDQRSFRGWTEAQWSAAEGRLEARGWVDDAHRLTDEGRAGRAAIEAATERLADPALATLSPPAREQLAADLGPLADRIVARGGLPYPNGMGVPPIGSPAPPARV